MLAVKTLKSVLETGMASPSFWKVWASQIGDMEAGKGCGSVREGFEAYWRIQHASRQYGLVGDNLELLEKKILRIII